MARRRSAALGGTALGSVALGVRTASLAGASAASGVIPAPRPWRGAAAHSHNLMPVPEKVEWLPGGLPLASGFNVAVAGHRDPRLEAALTRFLATLARRTGLPIDPFLRVDPAVASLVVTCRAGGHAIPALGEDESYQLEVGARQARLQAANVTGALRGLETLLQMPQAAAGAYLLPAARIADRPRFRWRGLLLDCSRHFQPLEHVLRTLEGMAAVKYNVLHWHLSDDQGFRVESRRFPRLTGQGSDGQFYTQAEIRQVIAFAAARGIRVLPEFDMPAHTTSWLVGYPFLGSAPGPYHLARRFGVHDAVMDPTRASTYRFLDGFFAEMTELFPDAYFHIGGDENRGTAWNDNPRIQAYMRRHRIANDHDLQAMFNRRIEPLVRRQGKKMMGWEEILNPHLPHDIVVEAWLSVGALAKIVERGYQGILSAGYYLDLMWPAAQHYAVDPIPTDSPLNSAQRARVLGGEACMWGEYVPPAILDSHIWPRAAAIAERFWSPSTITDANDMYRRLEQVSLQLEDLGMTHRTNQDRLMRWLARGEDALPLAALLHAAEPNKGYSWRSLPYNVFTPPAWMIYAVPPESPMRRWFPALVEAFLRRPGAAAPRRRLEALFASWQQAYPGYQRLLARTPQLQQLEPLYAALTQLSGVGGESVAAIAAGRKLSTQQMASARRRLARAASAHADLELIVIPGLQTLLKRAAATAAS